MHKITTPRFQPTRAAAQAGFSLIEILVTIFILLLGLLGLVGLMVRSQQVQLESYQRVQAMVMMNDMANRISANRKAAPCYAITTDAAVGEPYLGTGYSGTLTCASGTSAQQAGALADLQAWDALLKSNALVNARGCITVQTDAVTGFLTYNVAVVWQGSSRTAAPAATNCATGLYGDDTQRRAVVIPLQFTNLSS